MVDTFTPHLSWVFRVYRIFDMGSVSGRALRSRPLPFAYVLAADLGGRRPAGFGAFMVRSVAIVAARISAGAADHSRDPDPLGPGRLQVYLLLLPRGVLQGILGRSTGMFGR
jgi:hypothetical protein